MKKRITTKDILNVLTERCLNALQKEKETELSLETKELISLLLMVQREVTSSRSLIQKIFGWFR